MATTNLRPLSFGEILDGAFTLYRRHFATLALTSLLVQLPFVGAAALDAALPLSAGPAAGVASALLLVPCVAIWYALGRPALIRQVSNALLGQEVSRADGFAVARTRFWAFLTTGVLMVLAIGAGMLFFIVGGGFLAIQFFAVEQVVVLEGKGGSDALSRSAALAKGAWPRVIGVGIVLYLITYMPTAAVAICAGLLAPSLAPDATPGSVHLVVALIQISATVVGALTQPLWIAGMTLLYYDRRARTEALDLVPLPASLATVGMA